MTVNYSGDPQIESGLGGALGGGSPTPSLLYVGQAQGIVVAGVRPPTISTNAIASLRLYRGGSSVGPWTKVDERDLSPTSALHNLFDVEPSSTTLVYYVATAVDTLGNETGQSEVLAFAYVANAQAITAARPVSAAALGPFPLLGSDVFIDPVLGEAVVGSNGDLLTVNGLECLAQDIGMRLRTEQGELLLHPDFGNGRDRLIGSGQADPITQAQILRTRLIDAAMKDPRVSQVLDVVISRTDIDAWLIELTIIAIGQEDPQHLNLVYPFF